MDSSISESARRAIDTISNGEEVQTITLSALSNLKRPELSLFMKAFLAQNDEYRIHVINRMIEIAEDTIEYNFDNIFRLCLKDTHEDVRYGAVEGLWENEETSLIDPLIDILENDESAKVQAAAATALGKFAVMAELEQLHPESAEKVIDTLLSAIDNRDNATDVTKRVLESAASISLPDVHEAINNAYYSSNPDLKISALFAMGKSFDSSWLPILIQELENDDAAFRFEAAGACGELESPEAVPALVTLAENDEDIEVRCAAIQALGKIGSPPAQEYIQLCLKSSNDAVREAAEDALGFIHAFDETLFHEWKDE